MSHHEPPDDLRPYVADLCECVQSALEDFAREHGPYRHRYTTRTEASIIHDYMVDHVKRRFPFKLHQNLFLLELNGKYLIKLKKLDKQLRSRNYPTQMVLDFLTQQQLELFDLPTPINLQLGYQRHPIEVTQSKVWLTRPNGRLLDWMWPLSAHTPVELPQPSMLGGVEQIQGGRVRPKATQTEGAKESKQD